MRYIVIQPEERVKPYVRHFLLMENDKDFVHTETFRAFADGSPGLVFQQIPGAFSDRHCQHFPAAYLYGLTTKYVDKIANGKFNNIIACLHPYSIKTIFGIDAAQLTNKHYNVEDIVKTDITDMLSEVSLSTEGKITVISDFILREAAKYKYNNPVKIRHVVELLEKNGGVGTLNQIAAESGISERSVERLFINYVGITPKLFSRIQRFQSTIRMINSCENPLLSSICYDHEYSDQSHCIREFKEFTGTTPKQFVRKPKDEVSNFSQWS